MGMLSKRSLLKCSGCCILYSCSKVHGVARQDEAQPSNSTRSQLCKAGLFRRWTPSSYREIVPKDGKLFEEKKGGYKLYLNRWKTVLSLTDLFPSDAGSYMCNVSNSYGWIDCTYKVIHERFRAEPVLLQTENVTVYQGENVSLSFRALSDSMPHF
ncbi:Fibroblast growth factor receptor 2 [Stylophora pistillata]|uniref:Fibroblast growth factor receptor 2 n=1 Tax=Stylophora pistillata TaxID=50429 RepID=A0A2B4RF21_STYPI|nr:Fibroblast growth factor receptor 2 [Stylophora pistillata]